MTPSDRLWRELPLSWSRTNPDVRSGSYQASSADLTTAVITLNRPQQRNALSLELMLELKGCVDEIGRGREFRAVILAAAGRVFCSGHDLGEMAGRDITHRLNVLTHSRTKSKGYLDEDDTPIYRNRIPSRLGQSAFIRPPLPARR